MRHVRFSRPLAGLLLGASALLVAGQECPVRQATLTDANGDTPRNALGDPLLSRITTRSGHFEVFYGWTSSRSVESVSAAEAEFAANCLDAAWFIFCDGGLAGGYPFHNPLGSPHFEHPENTSNIPIWVRASCDSSCSPCDAACLGSANGGSGRPHVAVSPFGALFGCSRCSPMPNASGYDSVALHEFAHVLFKSYNAFLNSGPVAFLNEGLPSGICEVPMAPSYTPDSPILFHGKNLKTHLDLRNRSLRKTSYGGSPFWYWLAMEYTNIDDSDAVYDAAVHIPEVVGQYAWAIDPTLQVRQLPGRDVILHIQEAFEACHPFGLDGTPGNDSLEARCAEGGDPGTVPAGFPGWGTYWMAPWETEDTTEGSDRVGEALMPLVLDLIDKALEDHHSMDRDSLKYQAFREFLVANYMNGPVQEIYPDPANASDPAPEYADYPYRIKAFGAHYHEFNTPLLGGDWHFELEAGPDMDDWAYMAFHVNGDEAIPYTDWENDESSTLSVPASYDRTVVVVTCFETPYADTFTPYADTGGNYNLTSTWVPPPLSHGGYP